jgi:hypothetical protein
MDTVILHRIKAYLYDNLLTTESDHDYIARVISEQSLSIRDICIAAESRGGASLSASAMEHAVNLWLKEMAYQLCDGYSINHQLTPNRNLRINGSKLKIAGDKPSIGIRFRSIENPEAVYPVAAEDIITNHPSELVIVIPPLTADSYQLELTTQYAPSGKPLKEPRTALFNTALTVY